MGWAGGVGLGAGVGVGVGVEVGVRGGVGGGVTCEKTSRLERHTMTIRSTPPDAKKHPLGEKAVVVTDPWWPWRV